MSLADYYRTLREYEAMLAKRKSANLAAVSRQSAIVSRLKADEHAKRQASGARGRQIQANAGRFGEYGEPIVFIDGNSTNMTVSQYAAHLKDKANRLTATRTYRQGHRR